MKAMKKVTAPAPALAKTMKKPMEAIKAMKAMKAMKTMKKL